MKKSILSYINKLEGYKTAIKSLHWNADSLSQHQLCDDIAESISEHQDQISEVEQSINGNLGFNKLSGEKYEVSNLKSFVEDVIESCLSFYKSLNGDEYVGMKSDCESFLSDMQRKLYLVKFTLKEEMKTRIASQLNESSNKVEYVINEGNNNEVILSENELSNLVKFSIAKSILMRESNEMTFSDEEKEKYGKIKGKGTRLSTIAKDKGYMYPDGLPQMVDPKIIGVAYKVFKLGKDNLLYPVKVANNKVEKNSDTVKIIEMPTEVGKWVPALAGKCVADPVSGRRYVQGATKSEWLSFRPGWHLGAIPYATQFNKGPKQEDPNGLILRAHDKPDAHIANDIRTYFPKDLVWAEVEYSLDCDLTDIAQAQTPNRQDQCFQELPSTRIRDGYRKNKGEEVDDEPIGSASYRYWTNTIQASGEWIITSMMRVKRLLTPSEVDKLVSNTTVGQAIYPDYKGHKLVKDRLNDKLKPQEREDGSLSDEDINRINDYHKRLYNLQSECKKYRYITKKLNEGRNGDEKVKIRKAIQSYLQGEEPYNAIDLQEVAELISSFLSNNFNADMKFWGKPDSHIQFEITTPVGFDTIIGELFYSDDEGEPWVRFYGRGLTN